MYSIVPSIKSSCRSGQLMFAQAVFKVFSLLHVEKFTPLAIAIHISGGRGMNGKLIIPSRKRTLGLVMRAMPTFVLLACPPEMPLARVSPMHVFLQPCRVRVLNSCSTLSLLDW